MCRKIHFFFILIFLLACISYKLKAQKYVSEFRSTISLNEGWKTWMKGGDTLKVNIPHNWDDYYGYRLLIHGNLHGTATYIKTFVVPNVGENKRFFLRFEGVGTYATVVLNGENFGRFLGGRTTFTIDVTDAVFQNKLNQLTVIAEHPAMISDMPWVCGGCSSEWGFSEGTQPFGIFRPVVLEITDNIRIEPFGVHIWNNEKADSVFVETEIKNYSNKAIEIVLINRLNNKKELSTFSLANKVKLAAGETKIVKQSSSVSNPVRWSNENPYLYKLISTVKSLNKITDETSTLFGIRTISWPVKRNNGDGRFYLNAKPFFINGTAEYEHLFGQSSAFSNEQIASRVKQIESAGFNAFRDAHQPHNLEYLKYWDKDGILFWPQFSSHIWYDTPEFRENFKKLLRQWVKERRNSPSVILWGIQNESELPEKFAEECCNIIREMDPTTKTMRAITTCNYGEGTDWNVVQNWSGTYGGNPENYAKELSQLNQLLNGEYGAWRSIGFHTEPTAFDANGNWSENRACQLLETKTRLAEQAKDSICGQFQWIFNSHENPGRPRYDEGYRAIDKVGPFNYKGLITPWEEPTDAYYMYRANYVPAKKDPMVYIISHTWPDRFHAPSRATIEVYSNCNSVKLYNDVTDNYYLGLRNNNGCGTHFVWENIDIQFNVLRAVGFYGGKPVAVDEIVLNNLDKAPHFETLFSESKPLLKGEYGLNYIYRVNCGGDNYTDEFGQNWLKDDSTFSRSWAADFKELNPYLASQRVTYDPIKGVRDWSLFGHFRFGCHKLKYNFPVPDGRYRIELFFTEPWHGTGGGSGTDCKGLRIFDVAVNDSIVLNDLDIWAECGHDTALKKVIYANVRGGKLEISFPEVKAGEALISAVAIATTNQEIKPVFHPVTSWSWNEADKNVLEKMPIEMLPKDKNVRLSSVYEAEKADLNGNFEKVSFKNKNAIKFGNGTKNSIQWNISTGLAQIYMLRFAYINATGKPIVVNMKLISTTGTILKNDDITFSEAPEKWRLLNTTTGTFINAGHYRVLISGSNLEGLIFESLELQ